MGAARGGIALSKALAIERGLIKPEGPAWGAGDGPGDGITAAAANGAAPAALTAFQLRSGHRAPGQLAAARSLLNILKTSEPSSTATGAASRTVA